MGLDRGNGDSGTLSLFRARASAGLGQVASNVPGSVPRPLGHRAVHVGLTSLPASEAPRGGTTLPAD